MRCKLVLMSVFAALCLAATPAVHRNPPARPTAPVHPTRQRLIGAWRLVSIGMSGSRGPLVDPFYQPNSVGAIIYDASGWMSVQIAAPQRRSWTMAASRAADQIARDALLKSAAFDTYYAYFGTWDLDEATSTVTHHVTASLVPAETGRDYAQTITLDGDHLIFKGQDIINGAPATRIKVWERVMGVQ